MYNFSFAFSTKIGGAHIPYSREQKHVSVSDMPWPFQIAYEGDFRSLCTVTFGQKVGFLNSNTCQCSRLYGTCSPPLHCKYIYSINVKCILVYFVSDSQMNMCGLQRNVVNVYSQVSIISCYIYQQSITTELFSWPTYVFIACAKIHIYQVRLDMACLHSTLYVVLHTLHQKSFSCIIDLPAVSHVIIIFFTKCARLLGS